MQTGFGLAIGATHGQRQASIRTHRETVARVVTFPSRLTFRTLGIQSLLTSAFDGAGSLHSSTYTSPRNKATPVGDHGLDERIMVLTPPRGLILRTRRLPVPATYTTPCESTANPRQ